jgi:hypothetical protein
MNILKKFIFKQLKKRNLRIISLSSIYLEMEITRKDRVLSLIESLKPRKTNFDLIRLGPKGDGGYLVPNDLEGIDACFSPGVAEVSEFEFDCYNLGMKLFLADKSVVKPNLGIDADKYSFIKKYIGCTNNDDFITMDDWVKSNKIYSNSDLLLQMDIEGGEYFTILNMSDSLMKQFRIIVIEFHQLQKLWNNDFFTTAEAVFQKLNQTHVCVHIHPNNYCEIYTKFDVDIPMLAEFTFIRKDRIQTTEKAINFPHKLDYDNTPNQPVVLTKNWYE